jgi:integrase/recombinase XerD
MDARAPPAEASTVSRRMSVVAGFYRTCVLDGILDHSPAEHVRRPPVPAESPTLGLTHLQLEALLAAARDSANRYDFALVCLLGLLGLRIFEACGANIEDLGEEHGHRVLKVRGKGGKTVLVLLPPAVARAIDRATGGRTSGALLLNRYGSRMDRQAATRRLAALAASTRMRMPRLHPHMLRHTFVTTMLDWTSATCRSPPGTPIRARRCVTTGPATSSTGTPTTSWPPTWPPAPDRPASQDQRVTALAHHPPVPM